MRYFLAILIGFFLTLSSSGQTLTPVYFPAYMQGNYGADRVPYVCRFTVSGLQPVATYRYVNHFVSYPEESYGSGACIFIRPNGDFERVEYPDFYDASVCSEFTTDAAGSYTGWFISEPDWASFFSAGQTAYFRLSLNDGNGGGWFDSQITYGEGINIVNFSDEAGGGTAIRSTPATEAQARNFVFLYGNANPAPGERPVMGTYIESDGTDNTTANYYVPFYSDYVNAADKTWGGIIPNNLANGIRRIAQYRLTDAQEIGFKTSADGSWAKEGGGTVSTVNTTGGLTDVIVLDGAIVTLGQPVAQPQTINFSSLPVKTYGDADFNPGATSTSGLEVTYSSNNTAVATIVNGNIHIAGAGTADIKAEQAGNTDYQAAPPVTVTLTVDKANLTITAEDKIKVQGDPLPAFTANYSGFVNGEDATVFTSPPVFSTTADQNSAAGEYNIEVSGAAAANYTISFVKGKLTVTSNKQSQTITFGQLPVKTYGDVDFDPGATITSNLPIVYSSSDPSIVEVLNGMLHIKGAGTVTIGASHPGDANYEAAPEVTQQLTINKKSLTIKAEDKTRLVGQANPELTVMYTGFVYNETKDVLTAQPVIATAATPASVVGEYPITVSGATAANYNITHENGKLTVIPLPDQTITFNAFAVKKYGDVSFAAGATASSGLPITYSSSNPLVAVVENGMVRIAGAGTTTITASQPGNASNAPAPDVARTLTVQKTNLTIQAVDTSKIEGAPNPPFIVVYSGFVNGDDAAGLTAPPVVSSVATINSIAGRYTISVSGATSNNYNIGMVNGTLRVYPALGASQDNMTAWISAPGQLQVNIHSVKEGKATIQLFDQQGTRVHQTILTLATGFNSPRIPVGNLLPGIYHVRVYGPDFILKHKLVIR